MSLVESIANFNPFGLIITSIAVSCGCSDGCHDENNASDAPNDNHSSSIRSIGIQHC